MRIVAALGGNALLRRGEPMTWENQQANAARAAAALAPLCTPMNEIVITHGNGPQVGLLALQSAAGPSDGRYPLDALSAESEGMLGYLIECELRNAVHSDLRIASLLTEVLVDPNDPAFSHPTKPIGPVYGRGEADALAARHGWTVVPDGGGWRRAVASPAPQRILQQEVVSLLAGQGVIVVCVGGGGIPVARGLDGRLAGVEAVIDKDHASALLAVSIGADALLLLTDVDAVYLGWRTLEQRALTAIDPSALDASQFEPGSMRPKVEAAAKFVGSTDGFAAIGRMEDAAALLAGQAGTRIGKAVAGRVMRD